MSTKKIWSSPEIKTVSNNSCPSEPNMWLLVGDFFFFLILSFESESHSIQFSYSVVSDSLRPHGLQHTRPSLSPGVYSDSCPLSWWCHPTISSSVIPFSFCRQPYPASGSFPVSWLFASGGQSIRASAASVLPMNIQDWFPLGLTGLISLQSQGLSRVFSNTNINSLELCLLYGPTLMSIHDCWKNYSFDCTDLWLAKWCLHFLICCLGLS